MLLWYFSPICFFAISTDEAALLASVRLLKRKFVNNVKIEPEVVVPATKMNIFPWYIWIGGDCSALFNSSMCRPKFWQIGNLDVTAIANLSPCRCHVTWICYISLFNTFPFLKAPLALAKRCRLDLNLSEFYKFLSSILKSKGCGVGTGLWQP